MPRPTRAGRGDSKASKLRYRKRLTELANQLYGGCWKMVQHSPGRIVLEDSSKQDVSIESIHQNAVQMCSVRRYAHMSAAVTRDIAIGRQVPWSCVEAAWKWLQGPRGLQPRSFNAGGFPVATVGLVDRVSHVLDCMEVGWHRPDWPCPGELWLRWGVDGVPRWSISYVTLTMALTGEHADFKLHSVERFAHCAVLCGTESVDSVTALFNAVDFNDSLAHMENTVLVVAGRSCRVRSFLMGDHMLQYKATGASGPGSTLPSRQPCPYCNGPPDELLNWRADVRPLETAPRSSAPLQAIPRDQCIPDAMHGCHNLLHGVLLGVVRDKLIAKGLPLTEVTRICSMGLQRGENWVFDEDTNLKKSITQSLEYFSRGSFGQLLTELQGHLGNYLCMALEAAMVDMRMMVNIVYTKLPSEADVERFAQCALDLRQRLAYLKAPATIWGHVWTGHLPQFLRRWRTLYPFVCHGVEGKHRVFKADLQLSAGNQWRNGHWGFAQTLRLDRVRWQLFAEGTRHWRRARVPRGTTASLAHRRYEQYMASLVYSSLTSHHSPLKTTSTILPLKHWGGTKFSNNFSIFLSTSFSFSSFSLTA